MKLHTLPVILFLALPMCLRASAKPTQDIQNLIEQAEARANIFALPSFEMKASVRVDNAGKPLEGSYVLLWNGPEQWREEISLAGYSEVQVGGKGVIFLKRSTDFLPLPIYQLHSTLGYGSLGYGFGSAEPFGNFTHVGLQPNETIRKIHDRKQNGLKLTCAEIVDKHPFTREVCVDPSTGTLVRQEPFRDKEIMPIGTKVFPGFLSYVEKGKPLVEVHITELKSEQVPLSAFEPPKGAISQPGCMNPSPFHIMKTVPPRYPEQERRSRVQGSVVTSASIGKDGIPRMARVVAGVTPGLNQASLDSVQQWHWEPATCNGLAVEVETIVRITYTVE